MEAAVVLVYIAGMDNHLFCAQLRYWRNRRGISQLDLALAAGVSTRHVSFVESGRARPSEEMVLRLMAALDVPLRHQNALLRDAGYPSRFPEPALNQTNPAIQFAIDRMLEKHAPYPMTVLNSNYDIVRSNAGAAFLQTHFTARPENIGESLNMFSLVFDPDMARPFIKDWDRLARTMLARLRREMLQRPEATYLKTLLERILQFPGVPEDWRQPDFSLPLEPTMAIVLEREGKTLRFFTTTTIFTAPRQVILEELRIESYFPLDVETRRYLEG
jgi:transcriptional regulator with XRE-family HTH domain